MNEWIVHTGRSGVWRPDLLIIPPLLTPGHSRSLHGPARLSSLKTLGHWTLVFPAFVGFYLTQLCPVSVSRLVPSRSASLAPAFPIICILGPVSGFSLPNTDVLFGKTGKHVKPIDWNMQNKAHVVWEGFKIICLPLFEPVLVRVLVPAWNIVRQNSSVKILKVQSFWTFCTAAQGWASSRPGPPQRFSQTSPCDRELGASTQQQQQFTAAPPMGNDWQDKEGWVRGKH